MQSNIVEALNKCDPIYFLGVYRILKITARFLVTSCDCEKSKVHFANQLKKYFRANMRNMAYFLRINICASQHQYQFNLYSLGVFTKKTRPILLLNNFVEVWTLGAFLVSRMAIFFTTPETSPNI